MIRRIIYSYILFFFLLPCSICFPQVISKIEFSGINKFKVNDYLSWGKISSGMKLYTGIEDSIKFRIIASLKEQGI